MAGLIDATTGLDFGTGLQFQNAIGGAGLQIVTTTAFTPASLFTGGFLGDWWDANTIGSLYQDSAKTTPVTTDNDPVGAWVGLVNAVTPIQGTAGARPLYKSSNKTVLFDGVDDNLMTAANLSFSGYPIFIAILFDQTVNGGAAGGVVSLSASGADYTGIALNTPFGSGAKDRAAANLAVGSQSYPGASGLAGAFAGFASGAQTFQFNNGTTATGTATNTHAASRALFGALRQAVGVVLLFSAARVQQVVVINKIPSATEITNLKTYWGL